MDITHHPQDHPFMSPIIHVSKEYEKLMEEYIGNNDSLTVWKSISNGEGTSKVQQFTHNLDTNSDTLRELVDICDPKRLLLDNEDDTVEILSEIIPENDLVSLRVQAVELQHRKDGSKYRQYVMESWKYKKIRFDKTDFVPEPSDFDYIPDDVILTVNILKPYNKPLDHWQIKLGRLLSMDCAYNVPGKMPLTCLIDSIQCHADLGVAKDCSNDPNSAHDESLLAENIYQSRFLFVLDTFYNDLRKDLAEDQSKVIIDWCKKKKSKLGPFVSKDIQGLTVMDLHLRLGQPYLYQHQGNCEHLIVFTDIRLKEPTDLVDIDRPLLISKKYGKRFQCNTCKKFTVRWIVYDDPSLSVEYLFMCHECFKSFNYDEHGNKVRDFKAVPYIEKAPMLSSPKS